MELLFIVTEYDEIILINKDHIKKRFEFNDHLSYLFILQKMLYQISSAYQPTSDVGMWNTEDKGILVEAFDDVIGVRVNSDNGYEQTDSFIAYPDEALESGLFRLPTMPITGIEYRDQT